MCNHYICTLNANIKLELNIRPAKSFGITNDKLNLPHLNGVTPNNQQDYIAGLVADRLLNIRERRYTPVV